jgi:PPP family 3-phenylpropionic acid transporter
MATAPLGPALWALQALHAFTFAATHVGAMRIIQREAPEEVAGLAQTLYAALGGGLILGLATVSAGALYDAGGAAGYGAMAAMAVLGGILILPVAVAARRR